MRGRRFELFKRSIKNGIICVGLHCFTDRNASAFIPVAVSCDRDRAEEFCEFF
jgi:hypothetical protein